MNVEEAIELIVNLDEDVMLMARPPLTWGSEAILVQIDEDFSKVIAARNEGYVSLLDREDIKRIEEISRGKRISGKAKAEFVIHYAVNDAYPAWYEDLPDH